MRGRSSWMEAIFLNQLPHVSLASSRILFASKSPATGHIYLLTMIDA